MRRQRDGESIFRMHWQIAGMAKPQCQWKKNQRDEHGDHGRAAEIVNPFAKFEAANGGETYGNDYGGDDGEGRGMILRQPGGARAEEIGDLAGNGVEDRDSDGEAVDPQIPGGEEADEITEGAMSPNVEATFERHDAVEADDHGGHWEIKKQHGSDPGERLGAA